MKREEYARRLWPVDKLILGYFAFVLVLILLGWHSLPHAPALVLLHVAGALLLLFEIRFPNPTSWLFRNWYPLFYVAWSYREMDILVPALRHRDYDQSLANLDYALWQAHPTVWLERIQFPAFTEYLQVVYTLFVPAVLLVAFLFWRQRKYAEFQYYAFLISLGFLVSYAGYVIVPARGPRFELAHLQHVPLAGLWFFHTMQNGLDRLESVAYDCFPSGHTELTMLAWWSARHLRKSLFWPYFAYTSSIIFATVYLRYHYTIDVLAGAAVAAILLVATPRLYRMLNEERA
ncbi:MAG TPA: phosphatase PAP2 family protein [Bryobacteraceae bacterium]|nr:phosphatase PAP2 family protein [Bryobacteraceae bacterium]